MNEISKHAISIYKVSVQTVSGQTGSLDKTFVVTGATSGIGLAVSEGLVRSGASVIGVGRSAERCEHAETQLQRLNPNVRVAYLSADLSLQKEVRCLADDVKSVLSSWGKTSLDGLLNNAGTYTYWLKLTPDGIETQWAVNHLAPFLLTNQLLPLLQAAPAGRIVTVSSGSHYGAHLDWNDPQLRRCYNGIRAYGNTKLANVLFTQEMNHRLGSQSPVRAFAADPGLVKTDIAMKGNPCVVGWVWKIRRSAGISTEETAKGIHFLLTEPSIQDSQDIYWKHGQPKKPSREASDSRCASRLWEVSRRLCGMSEEVTHAA